MFKKYLNLPICNDSASLCLCEDRMEDIGPQSLVHLGPPAVHQSFSISPFDMNMTTYLSIHRLTDRVLLGVVLAMLSHPFLISEHCLTTLILAVEMFSVLHLTLLEATAFILVKPQQVLLPHIVRYVLRHYHPCIRGRDSSKGKLAGLRHG